MDPPGGFPSGTHSQNHSGAAGNDITTGKYAFLGGVHFLFISNNIAVKQEVSADICLLTQVPTTSVAGVHFALPRITQLSVVELILNRIALFISKEEEIGRVSEGD